MTDELRAKFEAWWQCLLQTPNATSYNSQMPVEGDYRGIALLAYQSGHASRDAEDADCQRLPKGWKIEVRYLDGNAGLCVIAPAGFGFFSVDGKTTHPSEIRDEIIRAFGEAMKSAP